MSRTAGVAASFAIVMVAYWLYALVAVPLIEPSLGATRREQITKERLQEARQSADRRTAALAEFFPPGSWELDNPTILESDQVKLLFDTYVPRPNGEVDLGHCTILFLPGSPDDDAIERREKAVLLQASQGAVLKFTQAFDLGRATMGELEGGQLRGQITIRSAGKAADPNDDLMIVTRDVQLRVNEQHIWTPHPVQFRWGPHFGQGREMHMRLLPDDKGGSLKRGARRPNIGGLESFELTHVERLHLETSSNAELLPSTPQVKPPSTAPAGETPSAAKRKPESTLPVEIACQGPFVFNATLQTASLEDRVAVVRMHPDGRNDQLDCDVLTVHFAPRPARILKPAAAGASPPEKAEKTDTKKPRMLDLEPRRLEAQGNPVVIRSPRNEMEAQGERMEYDLLNGRILVDGRQQVFLRKGPNQIRTGSIQYQPATDGRLLGLVVAAGPGVLTGQMSDKPGQQVEAQWNKDLFIRPVEQNQVISLTGGTVLTYGAIGKMSAGEIHFYLTETRNKDGRPEIQPDRMSADGNVQIDSPQFSGAHDQLEVWFKRDAKSPGGYRTRIEASGSGDPPAADPPTPDHSAAPLQHFRLTGRKLQAEVVLRGPEEQARSELSKLTLTDNVELIETRTREPGEKPTIVRGDQIEVIDASAPHGSVVLVGRPAHFESQGLGLSAATISVNRGTNLVRSDGPGFMDLPPMRRDFEGRPVQDAGPMRVKWQRGMTFDGRTVRFEGSVEAATESQQMRTDVLEVSFRQRIRFDDIKGQTRTDQPPDIQELRCQGGVHVDSRSFDAGRPQSTETIEVKNLVIDAVSGKLAAEGPGWLTSVRVGRGGSVALPGDTAPQPPPNATNPADAPEQLYYLRVRFQGNITGNVLENQREMTFHNQVRTTRGPVDSWQGTLPEDDPDGLGRKGVQLDCEHLSINEMPTPSGNRRSFELAAIGNAKVKGRNFTAGGTRISYDQAKNMLVLEGDGQTDAFISYQKQIGGKANDVFAQKIQYWLDTNEVSTSGLRSLEFQWGKEPQR